MFLIAPIAVGAAALAILGGGMVVVSVGLLALQAAQGGIVVFENLVALSAQSAGLALVAGSLAAIAGGLGAMAFAGFAAMPIIGALVGLATVAPALSGLADLFGGGGGGKEEDKMDVVVQKLDQLISVVSTPAAVTMDGRKVGDAIRLNINGTAIR